LPQVKKCADELLVLDQGERRRPRNDSQHQQTDHIGLGRRSEISVPNSAKTMRLKSSNEREVVSIKNLSLAKERG